MEPNKGTGKMNNFNLIRLLAAFEVILFHGLEHLKIDYSQSFIKPLFVFIRYFPGVPVFFTISGYLIYNSFKRNHTEIGQYFKNRFLRLYPGLWTCFLVTLLLLFIFNVISFASIVSTPIIGIWTLCQLSFFQFYTPNILRNWGVGTPNGSLWTLSIEIQFYILVPIIFLLLKKAGRYKTIFLLSLITLSLISIIFFSHLNIHSIKYKLSEVFVLPYLYNFLFGVIMAEYWMIIKKYVQSRFIFWLLIYMVWIFLFGFYFKDYEAAYWPKNIQSFMGVLILSILTLSGAYSNTQVSSKILGSKDISYGVYIYHMLVINTMVTLGYLYSPMWLFVVFLITTIISYLSWHFIERESLKLKPSHNL